MSSNPIHPKERLALAHLMWAGLHAQAKNHVAAHKAFASAHRIASEHRASLTSSGEHKTLSEFNARVEPIFAHLEKIVSHLPAPKKVSGYFKKSLRPAVAASLARQDYNKGVDVENQTAKVNRNPGRDSRYEYKSYDQLSTQEKVRASHMYQNKDMESHHYPFDAKSGEMVHASRWKAPPQASNAPGPLKSRSGKPMQPPQASTPVLPSQHKEGATVFIHSPSHEFHGTFAEVQRPNPQMPGKIKLKVRDKNTRNFATAYVDQHEVKTRQELASIKKSENEEWKITGSVAKHPVHGEIYRHPATGMYEGVHPIAGKIGLSDRMDDIKSALEELSTKHPKLKKNDNVISISKAALKRIKSRKGD